MAMIDIRGKDENTTEIRFSDEEHLSNPNPATIEITQKCAHSDSNKLRILKSDIPNLIAALNKAKELGWY